MADPRGRFWAFTLRLFTTLSIALGLCTPALQIPRAVAQAPETTPQPSTYRTPVPSLSLTPPALSLSNDAAAENATLTPTLTDGVPVVGTETPEAQPTLPLPPTDSVITPEAGGSLRSADGRVTATFPAGAVDAAVKVRYLPLEARVIGGEAPAIALRFALSAATNDVNATPVEHFAKPFELRVDLAGLLDWDAMPFYQYAFVGYWDEQAGDWVPLSAHREGEALVATLDHLTLFGAGTDDAYSVGWVLAANAPEVALFSGGLVYNYPIEVPEGRRGLTPDVSLNYSSRRVDGILTWTQADWVGLGWTLDSMEIVREIVPNHTQDAYGRTAWFTDGDVGWWNKFTLLYKGSSYELLPDVQHPMTDTAQCRYLTEDDQFLYIERHGTNGANVGSPVNTTSEYWIVKLKDGTVCRLGYNEDSEQVVHTKWYDSNSGTCHWSGGSPPSSEKCYAGRVQNVIAFRWRVDAITDTCGNEIVFSYVEENPRGEPCGHQGEPPLRSLLARARELPA